MPATVYVTLKGQEGISRLADSIHLLLSPAVLALRAIAIAKHSGVALKAAAVRACIEAVYDQPEGEYLRTQALLNAHRLVEERDGLTQIVDIDPFATVEGDAHNGREFVEDYAVPVHDGYTQWLWGTPSGDFHPGKFWFDVAEQESFGPIVAYVEAAWYLAISEAVRGVA